MPEGAHAELAHMASLNTEQHMAHDIVTNHLRALLAGRKPKQLLMLVTGQGGMGKSTMLNAITDTFELFESSHLLKKTALSGVTASLIGGIMLHWFAGLPSQKIPQSDIWPDNSSRMIKNCCAQNLQSLEYLAINELGMCTLDLITLLSQVAGKVRVDDGATDSTVPFGGVNIILMGDFY